MDDMDEGKVLKYDVAVEALPNTVTTRTEYKRLTAACQRVITGLQEPLKKTHLQGPVLDVLCKELASRLENAEDHFTKFAVIGDMATGKSSLINSLLSVGTIARRGADGDSCTSVTHNYVKEFALQKAPYAAKVYFYNEHEVETIMKELHIKYYRATEHARRPVKGKEDEDMEIEDDEATREHRSDAVEVIRIMRSLFCSSDEFSSDEKAHKYLSTAVSEDDPVLITQLIDWAMELLKLHVGAAEHLYREHPTAKGLLKSLQPYTYRLPANERHGIPDPCPLVRQVEIAMKTSLLDAGIVIVDSPGLSDSNRSRRQIAIQNSKDCSQIIVVADIARAESDANLHRHLHDAYRFHGSGSITLVLTRADNIDDDSELTGTNQQTDILEDNEASCERLDEEIEKLRESRQLADKDEKRRLGDEIRVLLREKSRLTMQSTSIRLEIRNRKVISGIQTIYSDLTKDLEPLMVHAVGNHVYQKYANGFTTGGEPSVTVEATGIPGLRRQLLTLPAEAALNTSLHLATVQLPALLDTFDLYCCSTCMDRKEDIIAILAEPRDGLLDLRTSIQHQMLETLQVEVIDPMTKCEPEWTKSARKLCRSWASKYDGNQHFNIIKKNGFKRIRRGKLVTEVNWNLELLELGREQLETTFPVLHEAAMKLCREYSAQVKKLVDTALRKIRDDKESQLMAMNPFLKTVKHDIQQILSVTDRVFQKNFTSNTNNVLNRAIMFSEDAYLVPTINKIFAEACQLKGRTGKPLRYTLIETEISKMGRLWRAVHRGVSKDMTKVIDVMFSELETRIGKILQGILDRFSLLCEERIVTDEAMKAHEAELKEELQKRLAELRPLVEGQISEDAEFCKKYGTCSSSAMFVS